MRSGAPQVGQWWASATGGREDARRIAGPPSPGNPDGTEWGVCG
jgi:hypothetical protein